MKNEKLFFSFWPILFVLTIIFIQIGQIFYFQRSFFLEQYDSIYWKDRFEHSQWNLPLSKRLIGDDGLFAYVGYQLVNGTNPAGVNVETGPVGKYLIGLSIVLFKNSAWYAVFLGLGSLILFYFIAKKLFRDIFTSLSITALFFFDPLFFTQLWRAWVDIAQLFFLLLHLFLLLNIRSFSTKKDMLVAFASGVFLGFFAQTKFPILLPTILILEFLFFYFKRIDIKSVVTFLFGMIFAILFSYTQYFLLGHSLLDFINVQKYIISFYQQSQLVTNIGAMWQVLILGTFPNISTGEPTTVAQWWIIWPLVTFLGIFISFLVLIKKGVSIVWRGLALFLLVSLSIHTLIPIYTRYLLIILPFFYLFSATVFLHLGRNIKIICFTILLLYGLIHATIYFFPSADPLLNNFYFNISNQYFQDVYEEHMAEKNSPDLTRDEFRFIAQDTLEKATVRAIEIQEKEKNISRFEGKGIVKFKATYYTQDLGSFSEEKKVDLVKEKGQWKIKWNWDIVLNDFLPKYLIETKTFLGERGSIIDVHGFILAEDREGFLVSVMPEKIDTKREDEMLKFIGELGYKGHSDLQNMYLENALPGRYIPLVTLYTQINEDIKQKLLSYPGVILEEYPSRIYPIITKGTDPRFIANTVYNERCPRIYSSYSYHGIKGMEKDNDKILQGHSGGSITIKDKKGNIIRTVLEKKAKNGKDVILPIAYQDLE